MDSSAALHSIGGLFVFLRRPVAEIRYRPRRTPSPPLAPVRPMSSDIVSEEELIQFTYSVLELHQLVLNVLGYELHAIESFLAIFQVAAGRAVVKLCPYFGFHPRVILFR